VGSAEFKARCLELVDHVRESHAEYIVTRHGEPVARLTPVRSAASAVVGAMRGTVLKYERPFDPVPAVWSVDDRDDRE
jgi:prevent-host-death family protein